MTFLPGQSLLSNLNLKLLWFDTVRPNLHANLFAHLRKSKRNNHQVGRKRENVKLREESLRQVYLHHSYIERDHSYIT